MVLKVNEFERDLDEKRVRDYLIDEQSNINYIANSKEDILNPKVLIKYIKHHHEHQKPRIKLLQNYYESKTTNRMLLNRRKETDRADHRASHPFAEYISDFTNGYFLGKPVVVNYEDDDERIKEEVNEVLDHVKAINDIDSLNRLIGLDLSICGRAYEIVLKNIEDEYRVYRLNPEDTFIIYDNSIEVNSLCAVNYYPLDARVDADTTFQVDVYTDDAVYSYHTELLTEAELKSIDADEKHFFGRVPITEYINNKDRRGDFEKVLSLIDMYDNAQVDTANYMTDLNDAMLVISGHLSVTVDQLREMKKANILYLEPSEQTDNNTGNIKYGTADAKYIYKQYDVQGSEAYKERLSRDIHLLTNTPNMTDAHFSGNASGESMKYKLFGLEQKTIVKEGMFIKGLRRRYKLLQSIMQVDNTISSDVDLKKLEYRFVRNIPKSITEDLQAFVSAGGRLSQETLIDMFGFVTDSHAELDRIENEQPTTLPLYDWNTIETDKVDDKDGEEV